MAGKGGEKYVNLSEISRSEYQPWLKEFERWSELILLVSELSVQVNSGDLSQLEYYYAVMKELYVNIRAVMVKNVQQFWDKKMGDIKEEYRTWKLDLENGYEEHPWELLEALEDFHKELLNTRQKFLGLGIPMYHHENSDKSKMDHGLLGK